MSDESRCGICSGINRRAFVKSSGLALVGSMILPNVFVRMAEAGTTARKKTLVAIFQRGAVDGLNVVIPFGEQRYYALRPSIAVPAPGRGEAAALDLDGFFGLHPALAPILPLFKDRAAAFVQAVGSPDPTRSHFDAQDFMESGTPGVKSTADGFLSRALASTRKATDSPLRSVSLTPGLPRILSGSGGAVAMASLSDFGIRGGSVSTAAAASFEEMYAGAVAGTLQATAAESFEAVKVLRAAEPSRSVPANGAQYPPGQFGNALRQIAQLLKSDVGLEIAFTDVGGWDTHVGEGGGQGQLANQLRNFGSAISAFVTDLGSRMDDVVVITMSEFGRTVAENGNRGTDHGHANAMLVLGGGVKGGKVLGAWPGLSNLYEGRDLPVTTDYRDVFAEVLVKHLGIGALDRVFPGYRTSATKWRGVMS